MQALAHQEFFRRLQYRQGCKAAEKYFRLKAEPKTAELILWALPLLSL